MRSPAFEFFIDPSSARTRRHPWSPRMPSRSKRSMKKKIWLWLRMADCLILRQRSRSGGPAESLHLRRHHCRPLASRFPCRSRELIVAFFGFVCSQSTGPPAPVPLQLVSCCTRPSRRSEEVPPAAAVLSPKFSREEEGPTVVVPSPQPTPSFRLEIGITVLPRGLLQVDCCIFLSRVPQVKGPFGPRETRCATLRQRGDLLAPPCRVVVHLPQHPPQ